MLVRCNACRGMKKIIGMGFIEKDCQTCSGTGYMPFEDAVNSAGEAPRRKRRTKEEIEEAKSDSN